MTMTTLPATGVLRRRALDILARLVVPDKVVRLPVVDQPSLKPVVGAKSRAALYRGVADLAAAGLEDRNRHHSARHRRHRGAAVAVGAIAASGPGAAGGGSSEPR